MSTPSSTSLGNHGALHQASTSPTAVNDDNMEDIPRRPMRVKILYTFDDQNKSNCLARLPNVLNIPVVSLDETTQVGVIELKTCIQAIVSASPELVAKLGHDFTVYAYDFSEYETPLVGQGMLSWILASASNTPNAPAKDSQTMVTGRVCKNILGIFSNGVRETLEVKLKLVPVPTCMQKEYVENMERYHSLSQIMPERFDYSAWSDFLKENPTLGQLAQPTPTRPQAPTHRSSFGGVEPFHHMLTRQSPSQDHNDSFYDQPNTSFVSHSSQQTRASSPANSTVSFLHYRPGPDSRPGSRASLRSEAAPLPQQLQHLPPQQQLQFSDPFTIEEQDDGPPRKRAKITQATRPKKTALTAQNDSLRVTAATAASVRLHKPILGNSAAMADLIPRAPTPQPRAPFGQRGPRRPPSMLRQASTDVERPYQSPYDTTSFSDHAVESADERDPSPGDTPMEMPSSPPIALQRTVSPAPSSPVLPTLPTLNDSGFVSDMPSGRDDEQMDLSKVWEGSDLPVAPEERQISRQNKSRQQWNYVNPGPVDQLPQSYVPRPKQYHRKNPIQSIEADQGSQRSMQPTHQNQGPSRLTERPTPTDICSFGAAQDMDSRRNSQVSQIDTKIESPEATMDLIPSAPNSNELQSRSATPNLPPKPRQPVKNRGLPRSHTWSGAGEPMSDAAGPSELGAPRSGSGAKRKKIIKDKLDAAIAAGELPEHCMNCGEIDTPTWRKAYTRTETCVPEGIEISTDSSGTGVIACETLPPKEGEEAKYRLIKNNLTLQDKEANSYEMFTLCNPCGLWLIKKSQMRPPEVWDKSAKLLKRRSNQGPFRYVNPGEPASDAIVPGSDIGGIHEEEQTQPQSMQPPQLQRSTGVEAATGSAQVDVQAAQAALQRAIQSSPAGLQGSKNSPIELDPDLTPKPTRRLLFPSPRKDGEMKTLARARPVTGAAISNRVHNYLGSDRDKLEKPRCQRCKTKKKSCDRERPCGRCVNAGIDHDGCIPCDPPRTNWFPDPPAQPVLKNPPVPQEPNVQISVVAEDDPDKENCPPTTNDEDEDGLAHLFESPKSPKTTPRKDNLFQDLLKTPTSGSRRRSPLTSRRYAETDDFLMTPSRNILTPRGTRAATIAPETPFTRQLNALLSSCPVSSPSQPIDFSAFPTITTPARAGVAFADFLQDDFLSSDMPMPSSPPKSSSLGLGFDLYEDPNTSTMGLWADASMFNSDAIMPDLDDTPKHSALDFDSSALNGTTLLKMNVGGMTVDFGAMIEEVVSNEQEDAAVDMVEKSSNHGVAQTPVGPTAE